MIDYVSISSTKLKDLFEKGGADCVAMWMKYAYHCKRQKTNQIKATQSFMENGMNWGTAKTRKVKNKLAELDYIEQFCRKNKLGQVTNWYVKVNHIPRASTLSQNDIMAHDITNATSGSTDSQMLKDNKDKSLKVNNFTKQENGQGENTYAGEGNIAPRLDTSKRTPIVSTFEEITETPLSEEECQEIYDEVTTANPDFEEILGDNNDVYRMQRYKTRLHYKAKGIPLKTRSQFISAIALYTLGGGPNRLNEQLYEDNWE